MSDLSFSNHVSDETEVVPRGAQPGRAARSALRAHERRVRFHIFLNLGFALAATWVLKIDGPYYADGISAGLFVCGAVLSFWSRAAVRASEKTVNSEFGEGVARSKALAWLFGLLPLFFLAAAVAIIYFTYIAPPDMPYSDEEAITRTRYSWSLPRQLA